MCSPAYSGLISSCVFPFPGDLTVLFSMESPAGLTAPALFPDVFSFTGTQSIDYSYVDLPDKHMIPFSPWLERHPAIWNALFSFSPIVLQTS